MLLLNTTRHEVLLCYILKQVLVTFGPRLVVRFLMDPGFSMFRPYSLIHHVLRRTKERDLKRAREIAIMEQCDEFCVFMCCGIIVRDLLNKV